MSTHRFGGNWTERKLKALEEYLTQYQTIFKKNLRARHFKTIYVDAFAGTGGREGRIDEGNMSLFDYDDDASDFQTGSVQVALGLSQKFDRYIFIDQKPSHVRALQKLIDSDYKTLAPYCDVIRDEANAWLIKWCKEQDWKTQRAVVFLDPYGMSVAWETIAQIASTKAVDLWLLFPYAIGANRMMPKEGLPDSVWGKKLTKVFGSVDWVNECYARRVEPDLFGGEINTIVKTAAKEDILRYFIGKLKSIFPHVVDKPMVLNNSQNSPMYALCFAAENAVALKIAKHLAKTR